LRWRQEHFFKPLREVAKIDVDPRLFQVFAPLASVIEDPGAVASLLSTIQQLHGEMLESRRNSKEGRVAAALHDLSKTAGEVPKPIRLKELAVKASKELPEDREYSARSVATVLRGFGLSVLRDRDGSYIECKPEALAFVLARYGLA
jgi:hypothetical protein